MAGTIKNINSIKLKRIQRVKQQKPLKNKEFLVENLLHLREPLKLIGTPPLQKRLNLLISKVIESKSEKYPVGRFVVSTTDNSTALSHFVFTDYPNGLFQPAPCLLPNMDDFPLPLIVRTLGIIGNAAYFGFLGTCQPKDGETVVVSSATDAIGSLVGQIAKISNCKVIGITDGDEKGKWLLEEMNFDYYINCRSNVSKVLATLAPEGIDCYFDMMGGDVSRVVISQMSVYGRVCTCGVTESYSCVILNTKIGNNVEGSIMPKQLSIEAFSMDNFIHRLGESISQNLQWYREGKLKLADGVNHDINDNLTFKDFCKLLDIINTNGHFIANW